MSNASGESTHSLHLVCLAELFFQFPVVGDIFRNSPHPVRLAFRIVNEKGTVVDPSHRTVRADDSIRLLGRL
jgi:hypothetical protein